MSAIVRTCLGALALALSWSCTYVAPPIQLYGSPADLEALTGEWWGEYIGDRDHNRSGTITFRLVAGENHAHGDVLMVPEGTDRAYQPYQGTEVHSAAGEPVHVARALSVRFVDAADGMISGELDPYWDPARRTGARATFRGRLKGHEIEGTFTTRYANGAAETGGRWKVVRKARTAG